MNEIWMAELEALERKKYYAQLESEFWKERGLGWIINFIADVEEYKKKYKIETEKE